ncbi:ABC transporter permease subunit [Pseudobacter ginsenosidimutans]|uniref:ABC-2 type transport system permease protein n=1 Tax=Pseudobacter ginsenosidimutans TaxID=661488 RepID=A0A4Q7N3G2_9BACT|nr:Gldg family protein [Pseudobacter ginsenosidimutans]QEC43962.1 ABC transporter permease subunit [Pseudobacter ginsenosidimutans]RZS75395.1 ABC-2 type transport system permease protein [Pseudobacter ginsenosidimutans]
MKIIYKIAKAELRNLFYSPVAWFVIFLFFLTVSLIFTKSLDFISNMQEAMSDLDSNWSGIDSSISSMLFDNITDTGNQYFYLFIPLLTMGLINREISNGTIRLLYSSPVTTREIVLGKYLGIVLFNMLLIGIIAIFLLASTTLIPAAEFKLALSIIFMYFLMVNAMAAIGLFISCLTGYQIVAAIITFAVFYLLANISNLWQQYDLIRDITHYLAITRKGSNLLKGLITSRDIIYFLMVISLFLGYTMIRLKNTQQPQSWSMNAFRYASLTLIVIIVGYFTSRPGYIAYYDATNRQTNTLHPAIQETIKEMDGSPLTVTLYTNLLDGNATSHGLPQNRNTYIWEVWEPYIRFYPNIKFRYEYYYDVTQRNHDFYTRKYPGKSLEEIVAIEAEMLEIRPSIFKTPEEMRKIINLMPEDVHLVMQLEYKGKKEFLRTYEGNSPWPLPNHFAATFKRLTRHKEVKMAFVTGHYERNILSWAGREFGWNTTSKKGKRALINEGVDADTISLLHQEIPSGIDALVVADPKSPYSQEEQQKLIDYLRKGGNAVFFTEIKKQFILAPVLQSIGVYPENGVIVRPDKHEMPHIFQTMLTDSGNYLAKELVMENFQRYRKGGAYVMNEGALNLSYQEIDGFKIEPIISKSGNDGTWIENGLLTVDSAPPVFSPVEGDIKKNEYVIGLKLSRKIGNKEQRIIVTGDADFMTSTRGRKGGHNLALYSWPLYNQYPVYGNLAEPEDRMVKISNHKARLLTLIAAYGCSALLLLFAIVLLVRRKRK